MPIKYHLVRKKDMRKDAAQGAQLVYGQVRASNIISFEYLCNEIMRSTTLTPGDVKNVINSLVDRLTAHLDMGNVIDVGELGRFRMSVGSEGTEAVKDFNATMFRRGKVVFTPGKALRTMLDGITFAELDPVEKLKDEEEEEEPGDL